MVNGALIIAVGIYLISVVFHGNVLLFVQALMADMLDDDNGRAGFLKWLAALLFLFALATNDRLRPFVNPLIWFALIGLGITSASNNSDALAKLSRVFTVPWRITSDPSQP